MTNRGKSDILKIERGFIVCPNCKNLLHGFRVLPDTVLSGVQIKCRSCKNTLLVDACDGIARLRGQSE